MQASQASGLQTISVWLSSCRSCDTHQGYILVVRDRAFAVSMMQQHCLHEVVLTELWRLTQPAHKQCPTVWNFQSRRTEIHYPTPVPPSCGKQSGERSYRRMGNAILKVSMRDGCRS